MSHSGAASPRRLASPSPHQSWGGHRDLTGRRTLLPAAPGARLMPRQNALAAGSSFLPPPAPERGSAALLADERAAPHSSQRSHLRARGRRRDGRSTPGDGGEAPAAAGARRETGPEGEGPGKHRGTGAGWDRPASDKPWSDREGPPQE